MFHIVKVTLLHSTYPIVFPFLVTTLTVTRHQLDGFASSAVIVQARFFSAQLILHTQWKHLQEISCKISNFRQKNLAQKDWKKEAWWPDYKRHPPATKTSKSQCTTCDQRVTFGWNWTQLKNCKRPSQEKGDKHFCPEPIFWLQWWANPQMFPKEQTKHQIFDVTWFPPAKLILCCFKYRPIFFEQAGSLEFGFHPENGTINT